MDMKSTVGIFLSRTEAERAAEQLRAAGIAETQLNMLTPGEAGEAHESVPTTAAEPPGIGKALGGVVGGAVGASSGVFGTVIAVSLIPGIGPILGGGLGLAALLGGIGGAAVGVAAGGALESSVADSLPIDELWVYDSALRQGRTVLIVLSDDSAQRDVARRIFEDAGAESVDAARERWNIGLSDAEDQHYHGGEGHAEGRSEAYQKGFEAALQSESYGRAYDAAEPYLQRHYGDVYREPDFRHGYEQGQHYGANIQEKWRQAIVKSYPAEGKP
jgi:hypothetical protein